MSSSDAKVFPVKGIPYRVTFCIFDNDGDLVTGATGLDSEISKDGGTFVDCTNEATEIATSSGFYFLDLTTTEMTADTVAVMVKTTSTNAKTTPIVMYPLEVGDIDVDVTAWNGNAVAVPTVAGVPKVDTTTWNGTAVATPDTAGYVKATIKGGTGTGEVSLSSGLVTLAGVTHTGAVIPTVTTTTTATNVTTVNGLAASVINRASLAADTGLQSARSNTAQAGAAGSITLDASASATTDFYKGAMVMLTGGTGVGQWRLITAYNGTTKVATVAPNWATNPDNTSTFAVILHAGVDVELWQATVVATPDTAGYPKVTNKTGTGTGEVLLSSGTVTTGTNNDKTGYALSSAGVQAIWDALTSALTTVGSVGKRIADNLDAAVTSRLAPTVAARTLDVSAGGEAGVDWANIGGPTTTNNLSGTTVAAVSGAVGSVTGAVGSVTGSVGSLGATAKSDVNAEVVDVMTVDTFAEVSGVPAATSTLKDKLNWLFFLSRNKHNTTATSDAVRNDADGATVATSTVSDDGTTFVRGKYS